MSTHATDLQEGDYVPDRSAPLLVSNGDRAVRIRLCLTKSDAIPETRTRIPDLKKHR
jgi:hypothetical protein